MGLSTLLTLFGTSLKYSDSYMTVSGSSDAAAAGGFLAVFFGAIAAMMIPILIIAIVMIIAMWKVFVKMGMPGWYSIIPIFNLWKLYEATGMRPWFAILALIPVIGGILAFITMIFLYIRLTRGFGKEDIFALGLILLSPIFMCILAFGKADWDAKRLAGAPNVFAPEGGDIISTTSAKGGESKKEDSWVAGEDDKKA